MHEQTDYFVVGTQSSCHFPLNGYALLSGMDKWLIDMKLHPSFYHSLCEKFMEYVIPLIDAYYSASGPLISLPDYREYYRPYQARIIELSVDVLSPVQPLAAGMDPRVLKREYGSSLTFLGGFDVQRLLPFGSPDQIRRGVQLLIDEYAAGGGYIFAPAYVIGSTTPAESIVAVFDEARAHGSYPIAASDSGQSYLEYVLSLDMPNWD